MPRIPFEKGNPGKPKGAKNKNTVLKDELALAFKRNKNKARKMLDEMFNNKFDFKWVCELKASIEPKEIEHSGNLNREDLRVYIVNNADVRNRETKQEGNVDVISQARASFSKQS
jgi:hypothetical protein